MEEKDAVYLQQEIGQLSLTLREAYGKRLKDINTKNRYIIAAQAKIEAYNEILDMIKEMIKV